MQNFQATLQDGLILATISGATWIVDTGAPLSFSEIANIELDGLAFDVEKSYLGMSIATVCKQLAIEADGILGMDILSQLDVVFNLPHGKIQFSIDRLETNFRKLEIEGILGVPILFAQLNGVEYRLILDSGAEIGYLFEDTVTGLRPSGLFTDMLPMYGMFETTTYSLRTEIGGVDLGALTYGVLPTHLETMVEMANVDGIIGNAALRRGKLTLSVRGSQLWFE